ncbi:MAG TPA: hypothetical protein VGD66_08675 [Allosphingosinicella sp.]|jgi:hypothetical protein
MIKIVNSKVGQRERPYELTDVTSESLISGVVAAVGDTWTIEDAADFLLAEVVRRTIVEDTRNKKISYLPRRFEAETVLGEAGTEISESIAVDVVHVLEQRGLIEQAYPDAIPPPLEIILTSTGVQRGITLIGRFAEIRVPASDRVVTLGHNDPVLEEIRQSLEVLRERILSANDIGDMTEAERNIAATEVSHLRLMLQEPQVRIAAALGRAEGTLRWIASQAGAAVIGAMALAILQAICSFFGVL